MRCVVLAYIRGLFSRLLERFCGWFWVFFKKRFQWNVLFGYYEHVSKVTLKWRTLGTIYNVQKRKGWSYNSGGLYGGMILIRSLLYPREQSFSGVYRITLSFHPSVRMFCKRKSSLTDEPVLMKLDTVAVYDLMVCMKENNRCPKSFKGNNWT